MRLLTTSLFTSVILGGFLVAACSSSGEGGGIAGGAGIGAFGGTGASSGAGGTTGPCTAGAKQCSGSTPQTCDADGKWVDGTPCPNACVAGECGGECTPGAGECNGQTPRTCDPSGKWVDGAACPFQCNAGNCEGQCVPNTADCKLNFPRSCDATGTWVIGTECPYGCDQGVCKEACKAGEFHCEGAQVEQCDPGPPAKWVPKTPSTICTKSQACDANTGTCVTLTPLGSPTPTGTYYQYASFKTTTEYKGGYDVDGFDDKLYVNRSGQYLDVYQVTLLDTDNDGKLEPDQHPDNPLHTGPMEQRTLKFIQTYSKSADKAPMGPASTSEIYALSDRIFALGPSHNGVLTEYIFATKTATPIIQPASTNNMSQVGFGDLDGLWYASSEAARQVYSWHPASKTWVAEFAYPNMAGSHMDGLEVVVSPATGEQYVYVSDMTSDFLAQYRKDPTGWTQVNVFQYNDKVGALVEGMGFGALNHFWITAGSTIYEIGGGDLAKYVE